jgi:hypothetical protein
LKFKIEKTTPNVIAVIIHKKIRPIKINFPFVSTGAIMDELKLIII